MNLLITISIYLLESIFAIGLIGCFFVLILATIDDVKVLFHSDKPQQPSSPEAHAPTPAPAISRSALHPQAH